MAPLLRVLGSIRWPILLLLLPLYLALSRLESSGGWVMVVVLALLVVFWGLLNDASQLERARDPRLGLSWDRHRWSLESVVALRTAVGALALAGALVLTIVRPGLGVWAIAGWGVLVLLCWLETRLDGQRRYWASEVLIPLACVAVPTLLIARAQGGTPENGGGGGPADGALPVLATHSGLTLLALLTGVLLGVLVLLCLIRDETPDRAAGYRTTGTVLGRIGSLALLALAQIAAIALAAIGVQAGAWHWGVPAVLSAGAVTTNWLLSARGDGNGVALWWLAGTMALWFGMG